ncbi:MAG: hypothetical protein ACRD0W_02175 [Acidimicrobiales bacterium]
MASNTYKVTERVLVDHPDGYQVLAAVPGDDIPMAEAVRLGLVTVSGDQTRRRARKGAGKPKGGGAGGIVTAEVRRGQAGQGTDDEAGNSDAGEGDDADDEAGNSDAGR